jgi:hypothetical protein
MFAFCRERVKSLVVPTVANAAGAYAVKFWSGSEWVCVVVDDLMPVSAANTNQPVYTRANDSVLWPLIMEKAYAKLHKSYSNIIGGRVSDGTSRLW